MKVEDVIYRQESRRCGRGCRKCPHGPYWYAFFRVHGRLKSKYIGKELPPELAALNTGGIAPVYTKEDIARQVLGIFEKSSFTFARQQYRACVKQAVKAFNDSWTNDGREAATVWLGKVREAWKLLFPGRR